jgi:hypothetical protein
MKMRKYILTGILFLLAGCSGKPELSCSDKVVTDTVMGISVKELREQLFKIYLSRELGGLPKIAANMSYDDYKAMDKNEVQGRVVSETEKTISALNLSNIRLKAENEKTGMISCAASLVGRDGGSSGIEYTAQYTENGETYVEVFGLR